MYTFEHNSSSSKSELGDSLSHVLRNNIIKPSSDVESSRPHTSILILTEVIFKAIGLRIIQHLGEERVDIIQYDLSLPAVSVALVTIPQYQLTSGCLS